MQNPIQNNEWEIAIYNLQSPFYQSSTTKVQEVVDMVHEYMDKKDEEIKDLRNYILALEYKIEQLEEKPEEYLKGNSRLLNRGINKYST